MKSQLVVMSIFLTGMVWMSSVSAESGQVREISGPLEKKIVLQREYLDGEMSEEIRTETIWSMEDFWAVYRDYQLVDQNEERIIFKIQEDDISPLLKANGFFGLSENGSFSIFNGKPENENIIQSFFQIDIEKLEAQKQAELQHGIPIINKDQYAQVIETFKAYSR
jgi:forespore regulator of the sigma-K checkpoint